MTHVVQDPVFWILAALLALSVVFMALVLWAARVSGGSPSAGEPGHRSSKATTAAREALARSFAKAFDSLKRALPVRALRTALPMVVVIRDAEHPRRLALRESGLHHMVSAGETAAASGPGVDWHLFDQAAVVELALHRHEPEDPKSAGSRLWDDFLHLCRRHRPDRPFDSVVLTIPAAELLKHDNERLQALTEQGHALHHRLWSVQRTLALRVPVYLVVTGAEALPGFVELARVLPPEVSRRLVGWSSPQELTAPFNPACVPAALSAMGATLSELVDEAAAGPAAADAGSMFLLPGEVERLRVGLLRLCDELFKESAYHEPFLLRGIYLSGDSVPARMHATGAMTGESPQEPVVDLPPQPVFLRDIFEKKVFAEWGQMRTVKSQPLRRPTAHLALRVAQVAIPAVWALGLVSAAYRLQDTVSVQLVAVNRIADLSPATAGESAPRANGALSLLDLGSILRVDPSQMGSVFIPGSWTLFDDLRQRVQDRIDSGVATGSYDPMIRSLVRQMSALTGVPVDEASGQMIVGASCALTPRWREVFERSGRVGISLEDTREYQAMLDLVAALERLDQASQAFRRLRNGAAAADPADYRVLASAVGVVLPDRIDRMALLFRRIAAQRSDAMLGQMQVAAACSFRLALNEVMRELFQENDLAQSEHDLVQLAAKVDGNSAWAIGVDAQIQHWQEMLDLLQKQDALMMPGKGKWMQDGPMNLGPSFEDLIRRVGAISLLGVPVAERTRLDMEEAFQRFLVQWKQELASYSEELGDLKWSDQDNRWVWSAERSSLRAGLSNLMGQQFMAYRAPAPYPEVPPQASIAWDKVKLDQALGAADVRRRLQTDVLPKISNGFRPEVERLSSAALANTVVDTVAKAVLLAPRGSPAAVFGEAERSRLLKINALLTDLGAKSEAERLAGILARDSLARLRAVDEALQRSDLYSPRERDFKGWAGERSPWTAAYDVPDAFSMSAYLGQQLARIESLARDAEPNLAIVEAAAAQNPMVLRWKGIASDLERYRLKNPGSSLMVLEQFLLVTLADLDRFNCLDKLGRPVARRSPDFFTERLTQVQQGLLARCRELKISEQADTWSTFSSAFNLSVAGRPPFVQTNGARGAEPSGSAPRRPAVDPDDLGSVLRLFERAHRVLGDKVLEQANARNQAAANAQSAVRRFDEQMERVRAFLSPLFPADDNTPAGLDLGIEFRAAPESELEGNKIIDWSLTVGTQTLRWRDPPKPLRWEPGMAITLSLRVAQNSPSVPQPEAGQPMMSVTDRTITYRYSDPWSLISVLQRHREAEAQARTETRSSLLRFEFPLAVIPEGQKVPTAESRARVFLRLTISPAGKRQPLAWPGIFPAVAPDWPTP
jgi:type VI secretion system protein ImpL